MATGSKNDRKPRTLALLRAVFAIAIVVALIGARAVCAAIYPEVTVQGETASSGIFDPSVEYEGSGAVGWLAYTSVRGSFIPFGPTIETQIARTTNGGTTWTRIGTVNASVSGAVNDGGTLRAGVWNYEVASLAHDPDDPGREWKLFSHRIFLPTDMGTNLAPYLPAFSWIAYRTASDPGGVWSPEVALFGSGTLPPAPYGVQVPVSSLDPSLAGLLVYSEPGALHRDGVLYVTLTGLDATGPNRIVLLASDDHGATWRFVASPLTKATEAPALGYATFDGTSLATDRGRVFLLAMPRTAAGGGDGTLVFEFSDLTTGALYRDGGGVPVVRKHVPLDPSFVSPAGGGQADYDERNAGGLLMNQLDLPDYPRIFRFFATGERLAACGPTPEGACPPCETCDLQLGCVVAPRTGCKQSTRPGGSNLTIADSANDAADRLVWTWKNGAAVDFAALGSPAIDDDYALCVYDQSGPTTGLLLRAAMPAGGTCRGKPCWSALGTSAQPKGQRYVDPDGMPNGIDQVLARSGAEGRSSVVVRGKGVQLALDPPAGSLLPIAPPIGLRVQLHAGAGTCMEATFSSAGALRNDARTLRLRSD